MSIRPPHTATGTVVKRDAAWRPEQTPEQTPLLDRETRKDVFACAGRGVAPSASDAQAAKHEGSFHVILRLRTARCGANLEHVVSDGPRATTRLRCGSNSVALRFKPEDG